MAARYEIVPDIVTLADFDEVASYPNGGYERYFYPVFPDTAEPMIFLCAGCARHAIATLDVPSDPMAAIGVNYESADSSIRYSGVTCDGCGAYAVAPHCPECGDNLTAGQRILWASGSDYPYLCMRCAAAMVHRGHTGENGSKAIRIPGAGVSIANATPAPGFGSGLYFAPVGQEYRYRRHGRLASVLPERMHCQTCGSDLTASASDTLAMCQTCGSALDTSEQRVTRILRKYR